jgi:hypothetical protein
MTNIPVISLGKVQVSIQAQETLAQANCEPIELLSRHALCDWSELDDDDIEANRDAIKHGGFLFSAYTVQENRFWILTNANKTSTTLFLAEE